MSPPGTFRPFLMSAMRSLLGANWTSKQSQNGANDPGCVKTQKIVERRERFFQDEVKSDSLRNFCAPKREFAKGPFYRLRSPSCFYAAKAHSGLTTRKDDGPQQSETPTG